MWCHQEKIDLHISSTVKVLWSWMAFDNVWNPLLRCVELAACTKVKVQTRALLQAVQLTHYDTVAGLATQRYPPWSMLLWLVSCPDNSLKQVSVPLSFQQAKVRKRYWDSPAWLGSYHSSVSVFKSRNSFSLCYKHWRLSWRSKGLQQRKKIQAAFSYSCAIIMKKH